MVCRAQGHSGGRITANLANDHRKAIGIECDRIAREQGQWTGSKRRVEALDIDVFDLTRSSPREPGPFTGCTSYLIGSRSRAIKTPA